MIPSKTATGLLLLTATVFCLAPTLGAVQSSGTRTVTEKECSVPNLDDGDAPDQREATSDI